MSGIHLRLGAINSGAFALFRSGLRWLHPDGHICRDGEPVAFCNLALLGQNPPFGAESCDFQVALAPRRAGRIRYGKDVSRGGYLDRLAREPWRAETEWGYLEDAGDVAGDAEDETLLTFYAGRRFTELADNHAGLLSGWHDRARVWTGEAAGATVLGAGTCEVDMLLRGSDGAFAAMLAGARGPSQIALCANEPLVHSSIVLAEALVRTPADMAAIREDIARGFASGGPAPSGRDWAFLGALLTGLEQSPLTDRYEQLGRSGLRTAGPAEAICLSLTTELPLTARHKTLGYSLALHGYRLGGLSPALRHWLRHNFEFSMRKYEDIASDYAKLAAGPRQLFVINCMANSRLEVIQNYQLLDAATLHRLGGLRARELNLMLHDLERTCGIAIIDAEAIAADLGMLAHFPDGFHATDTLIGEMRAELLHQLEAHAIPGFCPESTRNGGGAL